MKHRSPYKVKLDDGILAAWADSYVEQLEQKYFEWADECHNYGQVAEDQALELQHLGGLFVIFSVTAAVCLLGDLTVRCLYKKQCMKHNLDDEPAGVHATARGIKAAIERTADICLPTSSTWNLTGGGLVANGHNPGHTQKHTLAPSSPDPINMNQYGELANGAVRRGPLPPIDL